MKYELNETIATGKFKQVLAENYTKNFKLLCQSIKLNKVQQKILDQFINHGTIKNQYVGRVAGVKKEKKFFAAKKQYKGSIENRNEALMKALKVNVHQQKILDSYLKTGKVIGKYAGSIAGSTKTTKSYSAFRGFKEHFESLPETWETKQLREQYLTEGKISMAKLKKGDKVQMRFYGQDAKNQGFKKGDNPYGEGNKIQILGFGTLKRGAKVTAKNAMFKSIADFKAKWKGDLKALIRTFPNREEAEEFESELWQYDATGKLHRKLDRLIYYSSHGGTPSGKKLKADRGWTVFVYKVLGGEHKGDIEYLHISHNDYWAKHWHTDTDYWLES